MRLLPQDASYDVHLYHCNIGDYAGSCKYGEHDICPALAEFKPLPDPHAVIRVLTQIEAQILRQYPEMTNTVYRQAIDLIESEL